MATVTKGKTFINGDLVTPAALHQLVDSATVTNIADGDISSAAAIADTKLSTLSTAGKVANSATTATALATPNAIVARNGSGDFAAGTIFANLSGTATNVTGTVAVANGGTGGTTQDAARAGLGLGNSATLNTGAAAGTVATGDHTHAQLHNQSHAITSTSDHTAGAWKVFHSNGSGQVTELSLGAANSVLTSNGTAAAPSFQTLSATTTSANNLTGGVAGSVPYQSGSGTTAMLSAGTSGQVLRSNGSAAPSWDSFGTSGNTAGAVVARDGFGNFSAGTITANLSGNATNVTGTVAVANGGTGATSAANARFNIGLGNSATLNTGTASGTVATGDHTHSAATTSLAGFMSTTDKTKLDGATSANTASAIVARDASGNFTAGTITANLTGNASGSAATLATGRTISLTGDVTATTTSFNGSANVSAAATIANGAVTNLKLRNSAAMSVIGNVSSVAGTPGDITADTNGHVLRRSGSNIGFGQVTSDGLADGSVKTAKLDGGQTGSAPIFGVRAWVNFNGSTGATVGSEFQCSIRGSGNILKVVRTITGVYTIYFQTPMPSANYALGAYATYPSAAGDVAQAIVSNDNAFAPSTSFCQVRAASSTSGAEINAPHVHILFIG
jgi:hypothetical protein